MLQLPRSSQSFTELAALGGDVRAYLHTIRAPRMIQRGRMHLLVVGRGQASVLFSSEDRRQVDWLDFSIELIAGLVALMTGFKLGKEGYQALRPVVDDLYENDEGFRDRVHAVGEQTLTRDALHTGLAVRDLWVYIWEHHRSRFFKAVLKAVGSAFTARALLQIFAKWIIRFLSAGAALLIEIGEIAIPLNNKLAGK